MIIIKKLASSLALIVLFASFNLLLAQSLNAQSIPSTDNPQSLVGGNLQPTGSGLQNTGQVLAADSTNNYDSTNQNIKIDLYQAAKEQPNEAAQTAPKKDFPWRLFGLGALGLLTLFGLAKLLDRPRGNIFTG